MASNVVTDHYRRNATEKRSLEQLYQFAEGDEVELASASGADGRDASALDELSACVRPMLEGLPESYSEAVSLTDLDGLTQRDAGEELNLSHSGVKSRVQRGRVQLKQAIERCCAVERDGSGVVTDIVPLDGSRGCGTRSKTCDGGGAS